MSYILDALKKVEHEKTRKASAGGMTSISGDLFLEKMPRPSRGIAGRIIVAIVLVSLVAFSVTWFLMKGEKKKVAVASSSTAPTAGTSAKVSPNPPPPAPVPVPLPVSAPAPAPTPTSQQIALPQPPVAITPPALPKPQKSAVQTIPAPADIKVSGIAWQEERAARRVVINGFLLQEGATVSGAKILEIHQDRVRFMSPAGIFDLRMDGAASLPGTPK